jgi:hypothetical protein
LILQHGDLQRNECEKRNQNHDPVAWKIGETHREQPCDPNRYHAVDSEEHQHGLRKRKPSEWTQQHRNVAGIDEGHEVAVTVRTMA